jgi:ATP-dependent DNA helicase DinG
MVGGDLPGWLPGLFRNRSSVPALTDRRGECIRAACPHYRRCFIERSVRGSAEASLVVANHALTMAVAARRTADLPSRIVFDEGHHLFDAADSAFSLALTGAEAIELRRWLLGPEGSTRRAGRRRGLAARLLDVASYDQAGAAAIETLLAAARALPADGWLDRVIAGEPDGPLETLLAAVRAQVLTRAEDDSRGFSLETGIADLLPGLVEAAIGAAAALDRLGRAIAVLRACLSLLLAEPPEWLDSPGVARIEAADAGLMDRAALLSAWSALLARVGGAPDPDFVDWFALVRAGGQERDAGLFRHWLDPMKPLAEAVLQRAHGVAVTSATLGAAVGGEEALIRAAGAGHLATSPKLFLAPSPFDYPRQARVFIATDVKPRDSASLAFAFARLIEAAGGGTLGLFTAIERLRGVHARIADRLAEKGLPLLAQHVDPVDTGTLVDLFRADPRASLLGTDALRDGVDVPGESLRLLVFEGVPWSRPTILESARRAAGGGQVHEDGQVRRRLAQAFGRLIRTSADRGAFVLLGPQVPSRLLEALPAGVGIARLPLSEVAEAVSGFLGPACATVGPSLGDAAVAARKG